MQKVILALKNCFRPAKGVRSTRLLVEIHNMYQYKIMCKYVLPELVVEE